MARIRIGTSGYMYRHWRGLLYPEGLAQRRWLERYAALFDTVELNATFYRLPSPETVERWRDASPPGFTFAVKGSRYLTHMKRLLDAGAGLRRFYRPVSRLHAKLGPVLWQLPPQMAPDADRLDHFLARLPAGRHAVEFRDPDWYSDETCDVLDRHGAAFCEHDQVKRPPPRLTGGFRYVRFHGTTGRYAGRYGAASLRPFALDYLDSAARGVPVFVYFNNDVGGHAVRDALDLLALVGEERPALGA
ncbi:MAG TPA: DUF72 domain-containing protein [Anaeromyxobacter sp.]